MISVKFILKNIPRPLLIRMSYWGMPLLAFLLKGKKYTDPIDGSSFRKMLPYGYNKQRANALSPSTLSLERHRLLWLYLKNETDFFINPKKMLHIAPEQCFLKIFRKQPNLDYTTLDLYSPIADVKADICDMPFEDNTFDLIFCNHVLEHIEDDKKAMSELYRVIKKGGKGIFQVPLAMNREKTYEDFSITSPKKRAIHFEQYDHVRIYGLDYFDRLAAAGFEVKKIDYTQQLTEKEVLRYCLPAGEILPVCKK